jgi:hypothetical protein
MADVKANDPKGSADTKAADQKPAADTKVDAKEAKPKHVKMKRKTPQHPGGPTTATVHPDEVANFTEDGWREE